MGELSLYPILKDLADNFDERFEDFKSIAVNTLIGSIVESLGMIIGAYFYQIEGAIAGFGLGVLALYLTNKLSALKDLRKSGISSKGQAILKEDWRLIYQYSIPATLSALSVTPVFWLVRSMLVRANDYGELGIFEAADQWKIILLFIPGAICQIVLPIMSSITDPQTFRRTLLGNLALIGGIATVLARLMDLGTSHHAALRKNIHGFHSSGIPCHFHHSDCPCTNIRTDAV